MPLPPDELFYHPDTFTVQFSFDRLYFARVIRLYHAAPSVQEMRLDFIGCPTKVSVEMSCVLWMDAISPSSVMGVTDGQSI